MATLQVEGVESEEHTCQETRRVTVRWLKHLGCRAGPPQTFSVRKRGCAEVQACTDESMWVNLNE